MNACEVGFIWMFGGLGNRDPNSKTCSSGMFRSSA